MCACSHPCQPHTRRRLKHDAQLLHPLMHCMITSERKHTFLRSAVSAFKIAQGALHFRLAYPLPYPTLPYPTLPYPTLPYPTLTYLTLIIMSSFFNTILQKHIYIYIYIYIYIHT